MRISGQDPLLASIRRWRTCDRIAAGRSRAEVPALKARRAPAWCLSQKFQSTDTVTTAGTRATSGDLCVAGREQGTCASPVFSVTCCITEALTALSRLSLLRGEVLCSHGTGQARGMLLPAMLPCWDTPVTRSSSSGLPQCLWCVNIFIPTQERLCPVYINASALSAQQKLLLHQDHSSV